MLSKAQPLPIADLFTMGRDLTPNPFILWFLWLRNCVIELNCLELSGGKSYKCGEEAYRFPYRSIREGSRPVWCAFPSGQGKPLFFLRKRYAWGWVHRYFSLSSIGWWTMLCTSGRRLHKLQSQYLLKFYKSVYIVYFRNS